MYAYDILTRHAHELGFTNKAKIQSLYDSILKQPAIIQYDPPQVACRVAMVILTCAVCGVNVNNEESDHRFVRRHSKARIKQHVFHYTNGAYGPNGSGRLIPLTVASEILQCIAAEDDPQWEHMVMAVSGKFGTSKQFSSLVRNIFEEVDFEEEVIVPEDIQKLMKRQFIAKKKIGKAEHYYGYPVWTGIHEEERIIRIRTFEGPKKKPIVEDYDLLIEAEEAEWLKIRYTQDLESPGPIRTKMITFVAKDGKYWSSYLADTQKIPGSVVGKAIKADVIEKTDGFDLGMARNIVDNDGGVDIGIEYWGGMARYPHTELDMPRVFFTLVSEKGNIDLFGHPKLVQIEFFKCGIELPTMGFHVNSEISPKIFEKLHKYLDSAKMLIKKAKRTILDAQKVASWFESVGAEELSFNGSTIWEMAWSIVEATKNRQASMIAGDLIMMSVLAEHSHFEMNGIAWDF